MSLILSGDTGVPVTTVTGTLPVANGGTGVTTAIDYGFRNRIINGAMVIDQRNAGASVTITNTSAITYTLDRMFGYGSIASKFTVQQNAGAVTPPAGFINYLGATSSSAYSVLASDQFTVGQTIEGLNIADLAWGTANAKTVTLSFQVYSSLTGTFGGSLRNSATNRSYPFSYSIPVANTWTTISITIAGDTSGTWLTTNGIGIQILFGLGTGATYSGTAGAWAGANYFSATGATSVVGTNGATFYITGVQLEKGSTATSFDYRPYGTELALCQRYAQMNVASSGYITSTTSVAAVIFGQSQMRSSSIALVLINGTNKILDWGGGNRTISAIASSSDSSITGIMASLTVGTTTTSKYHALAGDAIILTAEL